MPIRDALGRAWLAGAALAITAILAWLLAATLAPLTLGDIMALQFVWDPAAFMTVLREWTLTFRLDRFVMHVALDAPLALAYGTFLACCIALALRRTARPASWDLLLLGPAVVVVLDLVENLLQVWIVGAVLPEGAVPAAAAVSLAKWALVGASITIAGLTAVLPRPRAVGAAEHSATVKA